MSSPQTSVQPPLTVSEAAFRSQWVGPQADRMDTMPVVPTAEREIEPITDWASKLRQGLFIGSLRISPGLGAGYEYSNRNQNGQQTNQSTDQSFYIAPSLGLDYSRELGPWTLSIGYGGGYVYYVNPNFTASQSGNQRNPLNQTVRFRLGHLGVRHEAKFSAAASYGNGQNIQVGGNTTTASVNVGLDYSYLLTEYVTTGLFASLNAQFTRYGDNNNSGSDLTNLRAGGTVDWLWTGKTTLGAKAEFGQSAQLVQSGNDNTDGRAFAQILFTAKHSLTSKLLLTGGLGVGYVADQSVSDENSQYAGIRPVYQISLDYVPTEKTSLRLFSNFDGTEVVPDYGLIAGWRPRETTALSLSIYQDQNFSLTTTRQYQVNRGFVATVSQRLFSKITLGISGGWQQTDNVSLSENQPDGNSTNYSFLSGNFRWDLNDWLYWQATLWSSTGNRSGTSGANNYPETIGSVGLNLIF